MKCFLFALLLAAATPAVAEETGCGKSPQIEAALSSTFGEQTAALGLSDAGKLMRLWVNPNTGSWTITGSTASGITCVLAYGDGATLLPVGDPA